MTQRRIPEWVPQSVAQLVIVVLGAIGSGALGAAALVTALDSRVTRLEAGQTHQGQDFDKMMRDGTPGLRQAEITLRQEIGEVKSDLRVIRTQIEALREANQQNFDTLQKLMLENRRPARDVAYTSKPIH